MSATDVAEKWVDEAARLTQPSRTVWCDRSKAEYDGLIEAMPTDGTLLLAEVLRCDRRRARRDAPPASAAEA